MTITYLIVAALLLLTAVDLVMLEWLRRIQLSHHVHMEACASMFAGVRTANRRLDERICVLEDRNG